MRTTLRAAIAAVLVLNGMLALPGRAAAQAIDMSQGGPVTVTAAGGIDWDQKAQTVTAYDDARAVRGAVTVDADRLIAYYRKKKAAPGAAPEAAPQATKVSAPGPGGAPGPGDDLSGSNEIYRLQAIGHVHIYTATDQAWGDRALYDIDQAVLVLTGHALRIVTPSDTVTARDSLEYWPQRRMSVARGDAVLTTSDGRRIAADVLVGYSAPDAPGGKARPAPPPAAGSTNAAAATDPLASSGKLKKAEAYGNVVVRTQTETVRGDRGVYVPDTGIARIVGNVHITRGQNQLNGRAAIVNMHTGLATLTEDPGDRVQGLIVPNDATSGGARPGTKPGAAQTPPSRGRGT